MFLVFSLVTFFKFIIRKVKKGVTNYFFSDEHVKFFVPEPEIWWVGPAYRATHTLAYFHFFEIQGQFDIGE